MLYIAWMVILGDHNIKNISFGNFNLLAAEGEKLHKQVVYQSRLIPPSPPRAQYPNRMKNRNHGLKHALHSLEGRFT